MTPASNLFYSLVRDNMVHDPENFGSFEPVNGLMLYWIRQGGKETKMWGLYDTKTGHRPLSHHDWNHGVIETRSDGTVVAIFTKYLQRGKNRDTVEITVVLSPSESLAK